MIGVTFDAQVFKRNKKAIVSTANLTTINNNEYWHNKKVILL